MNSTLEIAVLVDLKSEELDDVLLVTTYNPRKEGYLRSNKYGRINLDMFSEKEFRRLFRFQQKDLESLVNAFGLQSQIVYESRYHTTAWSSNKNCWGFIDGTARAICRPSKNQEQYYSGHKRKHCLKYLSVICPDGIITTLVGPYPGRRHDSGILQESNLYAELEKNTIFE
ncbi:DDE Tnp4 domain-containing protein [Caerostris darwini]|uniref:DDE Tnp4 domain-containing protein n=1 Tax=Caerostris darwini TaxID=1538125 RepID=A0AAV4UY62_9ARAC|nr:DDE Tnp4 domain-containing protein [Caerostris darwini]